MGMAWGFFRHYFFLFDYNNNYYFYMSNGEQGFFNSFLFPSSSFIHSFLLPGLDTRLCV